MKTPSISQNKIEEKWYIIDAAGKRVGRLATVASQLLLGKTNPLVKDYLSPNAKVIVINAEKIDYLPKRGFSKFYKRFSGYPSGLTMEDFESTLKRKPTFIVENAIRGMLPKGKRGKAIFTNLKVFVGNEHTHEAQKPEVIDINKIRI